MCCSCTWHSTCSTTVLSARACEFSNAGQKFTGCYCWQRCKNKGRLMRSPTTERGLLGHFPLGIYPSTTDQRASHLPIRLPTSSSLWAILVAGTGGGGTQSGAGRRRIPRDSGSWGSRAGVRNRDIGGDMRSKTGEARRNIVAIATTAYLARGERSAMEDPKVR